MEATVSRGAGSGAHGWAQSPHCLQGSREGGDPVDTKAQCWLACGPTRERVWAEPSTTFSSHPQHGCVVSLSRGDQKDEFRDCPLLGTTFPSWEGRSFQRGLCRKPTHTDAGPPPLALRPLQQCPEPLQAKWARGYPGGDTVGGYGSPEGAEQGRRRHVSGAPGPKAPEGQWGPGGWESRHKAGERTLATENQA